MRANVFLYFFILFSIISLSTKAQFNNTNFQVNTVNVSLSTAAICQGTPVIVTVSAQRYIQYRAMVNTFVSDFVFTTASGQNLQISMPGSALQSGDNSVTVLGSFLTSTKNTDLIPVLDNDYRSALALRAKTPITIDGILNESSWTLTNQVKKQISTGVGTSAGIMFFGALYDTSYLYIAAKVTDTAYYESPNRDNIELYLRIENSPRGGNYWTVSNSPGFIQGYTALSRRQTSLQYILDWGRNTIRWWTNSGNNDRGYMAQNVTYATSSATGFVLTFPAKTFYYEAAFPWSTLGVHFSSYYPTLTAGGIAFDAAFNDISRNGGNIERTGQLMWNGGGNNWNTDNNWGSLFLSPYTDSSAVAGKTILSVFPPNINATLSGLTQYCESTTISGTFNTSDNRSYYWQSSAFGTSTTMPASLSTSTGITPYITTLVGSSSVYVRALINNSTTTGCWSDPIGYNLQGLGVPNVPPAPSGASAACDQLSLIFTTPTTPGLSYYWQTSDTGMVVSAQNLVQTTRIITATGTFFIRAKRNENNLEKQCWSAATSKSVVVEPTPTLADLPTLTQIKSCGITTVSPSFVTSDKFDYYWQTSTTGLNTANTVLGAMLHTVSGTAILNAKSKNLSCWSGAAIYRQLNYEVVYENVTIPSVINEELIVGQDAKTLTATPMENATLKWYDRVIDTLVVATPAHNPVEEGTFTYKVSQSVTKNGVTCESAKNTLTVVVKKGTLLLYENAAITPNNDLKNDDWEIPYINYYPNHTISIFDKWGNVVFERKGGYEIKENRFNGTNAGADLPAGVYFYVVDYGSDSRKPDKGTVTIIR
ncbi:MAG: gliding motility-associated C-terminal domain-containing protein [Cytophagales bacterium]|nr:gliding motility-associated C-terminal domain-containing protein [Cytophagales bacterium]